jgi:hypothetical protein
MPAVAGTARRTAPRARGNAAWSTRHQWRARTCSASLYTTSLQHARPPHSTLCLGGSLNILLAAPECMVKGR